MNELMLLTKVQFKNYLLYGLNSSKNPKKAMALYGVLTVLLLICLVPFIFISKVLGEMFLHYDITSNYSMILVPIIALVLCLFSLISILTYFFLNDDVKILLSLPIKPLNIMLSKFFVSLSSSYFILSFFFLPLMIGFGIGIKADVFYYFASIIVFIFLPFIINGILVLIFSFVFKLPFVAKVKEKIQYFVTFFSMFFGIGISLFMQNEPTLENLNVELISNFASNASKIGFIFYPAVLALNSKGALKLLFAVLFILEAILVVFICLKISTKVYMKTLLGKPQIARKEKSIKEVKKQKETSLMRLLLTIEFKKIYRSPTFSMNLLLFNIIFPFLIIGITLISVITSPEDISIKEILGNVDILNSTTFLSLLASSVFIGSFSFTGATSFSRDGNDAIYLKLLPVSKFKYFMMKVIFASLLSLPFLISLMVVLPLVYGLDGLIMGIMIFVNSALIYVCNNIIAAYIDLKNPKIKWDSEIVAVKNNINPLFPMIIDFVLLGLFILLAILLAVKNIEIHFLVIALTIAFFFSLLCGIMVKLLKKYENTLFNKVV